MLQYIRLFRVRHDLAIEKQKHLLLLLTYWQQHVILEKNDFGAKKITSINLPYKVGDIGKVNWPLGP